MGRRTWMAAVAGVVAGGTALAQGPPIEGGRPVTLPPVNTHAPAPPMVPPLGPLVGTPVPACEGCGSGPVACAADVASNGGTTLVGPKQAAWVRGGPVMYWFQPGPRSFPLAVGGQVGTPTRTLIGGDEREFGPHLGGRIDLGAFVNPCHDIGIGGGGFITEHRSVFDRLSGRAANGQPNGLVITRPFTDAVTGRPSSLTVSDGLVVPGTLDVQTTSRLAGAKVYLRKVLSHDDCWTADLLLGFRYLDLDESLAVRQSTTVATDIAPAGPRGMIAAGTTVSLFDRVYARNQFYGGELGGRFERRSGMLFATLAPSVFFGPNHESVRYDGRTTIPGQAPIAGGLLVSGAAPNGNLTRVVTSRFAVGTEIDAAVGVALRRGLRVSFGYSFLYLNNVARPGSQLDPTINTRGVPVSTAFGSLSGPPGPLPTKDREGFYAHGATATLEVRY